MVVVGTNFTSGLPRMAAATARQVSASMPWITPLLSASENPATPVDTPHTSWPRDLMASMVADPLPCAAAGGEKASPAPSSTAPNKAIRFIQ